MADDVFLSYAHGDYRQASQLVGLLRSNEISIWFDKDCIEPAAFWPASIVEAIQRCKVTLVLLSETSVDSKYVARELALAARYDKPIVPLMLEAVPVPVKLQFQLAGIQRVMLYQEQLGDHWPDIARAIRRHGVATGSSAPDWRPSGSPEARGTVSRPVDRRAKRPASLVTVEEKRLLDVRREAALRSQPVAENILPERRFRSSILLAVEAEKFSGLLLQVERFLDRRPGDQEMKEIAQKLEQLEDERDQFLKTAEQQFDEQDYLGALQSLNHIHKSLHDDEVIHLRRRSHHMLFEIWQVCRRMRTTLTANDDDGFHEALETLWRLLPEPMQSRDQRLPPELERQLGFTGHEPDGCRPSDLAPKLQSFLVTRYDHPKGQAFARRLRDWETAENIWRKLEGTDLHCPGHQLWSPIDRYLTLHVDDGHAQQRVRELMCRRDWQFYCFDGHVGGAHAVWFSSDGNTLFSRDRQHGLRRWNLQTGREIGASPVGRAEDQDVWYTADGTLGVSLAENSQVQLWNAATGEEIWRFEGNTGQIRGVAVSPDRRFLAAAGDDHSVRQLDMVSGRQVQQFNGHAAGVVDVVYSPNGSLLVSSGRDRTIRLWDVETASESQCIDSATQRARGLMVCNGNQHLSWIGDRGKLLVSNWERGRVFELGPNIQCAVFSPDGSWIGGGCEDNLIRIWDAETGAELTRLRGHHFCVSAITATADGKYLLTGSEDETVRLWDVQRGHAVRCFRGHRLSWWNRQLRGPANINALAISPNGRYAASASDDGTVRVWFIGGRAA